MAKTKEELKQDIENILQTLRGGLAMHGGNVELVEVEPEAGRVFVRMQGACVGCPMSDLTLKAGIEETIREMLPEIKEVVAVDPEPSVDSLSST
jgi:Fe-S cluster biogenesis protein NfuA